MEEEHGFCWDVGLELLISFRLESVPLELQGWMEMEEKLVYPEMKWKLELFISFILESVIIELQRWMEL